MIIVGIDPGLNGGIAFLRDKPGRAPQVRSMPTLKAGKTKRELDERAITLMLDKRRGKIEHVIIEKVQAMPASHRGQRQGVVSMFNFGMGFGILRGICTALYLPYTLVHPATWKKVMCAGMPKGKDASIIVAKRLWPTVDLLATKRSRKDHDGMADALCLAEYGRRTVL